MDSSAMLSAEELARFSAAQQQQRVRKQERTKQQQEKVLHFRRDKGQVGPGSVRCSITMHD